MEQPGNRYHYFIFLLLILVVIVVSYSLIGEKSADIGETSEYMMDTRVTIKYSDSPEARRAVDRAFREMKEREQRLNRHLSSSEVARLNRSSGQEIEVSEELIFLLQQGNRYYRLSRGKFDPTIAPLLDVWGFGSEEPAVPDPAIIESVLENIGFDRLKIHPENRRVVVPPRISLDLGGMAKGYIVDRGYQVLEEAGLASFFINAGGNIRIKGEKPGGKPWEIGIQKPRQQGVFRDRILAVTEGSLATSGDYQRFFKEDGRRYSHLLDPDTGYPAREIQSVTIYAPEALQADALSTAVFIMGLDSGRELIERLPEIEGFMVTPDSRWESSGFTKIIKGN